MKKNALLSMITLTIIGFSLTSQASVWRVNGAPGSGAAYTTIQLAHDAATTLNGDTLYIEGSAYSAGGLSCSKQLVIIGAGYFLAQNPQTQAATVPSTVDYIYYYAGSQGSKVAGCTVSYIYLQTNNILITRNKIGAGASYGIYNQAATSNIIISQNYIEGSTYPIYFPNPANNILITNNFLNSQYYYYSSIYSTSSFSGIIVNNVIGSGITVDYATLKNNILVQGDFTAGNNIYTNNIGSSTQFGTTNGNQSNVTMSNVFVGVTGTSTDGQWVLKAGSPAIGAGEGGINCGMYGGLAPYVLSGMPNIPAIYYFNAPSLPTNSINVSIKAKSHN